MITNEADIRIALQAVLVTVLALSGYWGCAVVVIFILLPWKPILAVGVYLAQPLVDWRIQRARERREKGIAQIERELDNILRTPKEVPNVPSPAPSLRSAGPTKFSRPAMPRPLESFKPRVPARPAYQDISESAPDLAATLEIPPAIKNHVRNLPQGVFSNMDLEVDEVKFHGETADAYVRFKSSNVAGLVIRQRYFLRRSGDHWEVESRQPANSAAKAPPQYQPTGQPHMRLT